MIDIEKITNIDDLILGLLFLGCPGKLVERFVEEVRRDRNNPFSAKISYIHLF